MLLPAIFIFCFSGIVQRSAQFDLSGLTPCHQYDKHLAAERIIDAIKHFPDLTLHQYEDDKSTTMRRQGSGNPLKGKVPGELDVTGMGTSETMNRPGPESCHTVACKACSSMLLDQLTAVGMIDTTEKRQLQRKLVTQSIPDPEQKCKRLAQFEPVDQTRVKALSKQSQSQTQVRRTRHKRNAREDQEEQLVGNRTVLRTVKQGKPLNRNSPWISLCDVDWVWRALPEGFIPRYHNELLQGGDGKCLSGYGTCKQMYHNFDVAQRKNDGSLITKTIRVARAVNCVVTSDSAAYELASGKANGRLPRVP